MSHEKVTGFQSPSAEKWNDFQEATWDQRPFGDYDVDVQIECCGVCASDRHKICGDWSGCPYPLAVGHEIVGKVLQVGPKVTLAKAGQRIGVGAQILSCMDCKQCKNNNETYCKRVTDTYGSIYPGTEFRTQGGFSTHYRCNEYW